MGYQAPDFLSYYTMNCPYKIYSDEIIADFAWS